MGKLKLNDKYLFFKCRVRSGAEESQTWRRRVSWTWCRPPCRYSWGCRDWRGTVCLIAESRRGEGPRRGSSLYQEEGGAVGDLSPGRGLCWTRPRRWLPGARADSAPGTKSPGPPAPSRWGPPRCPGAGWPASPPCPLSVCRASTQTPPGDDNEDDAGSCWSWWYWMTSDDDHDDTGSKDSGIMMMLIPGHHSWSWW